MQLLSIPIFCLSSLALRLIPALPCMMRAAFGALSVARTGTAPARTRLLIHRPPPPFCLSMAHLRRRMRRRRRFFGILQSQLRLHLRQKLQSSAVLRCFRSKQSGTRPDCFVCFNALRRKGFTSKRPCMIIHHAGALVIQVVKSGMPPCFITP